MFTVCLQVQIRPWNLNDSDFVMDGSQPLDPRKTIFVGGVPRPLRAGLFGFQILPLSIFFFGGGGASFTVCTVVKIILYIFSEYMLVVFEGYFKIIIQFFFVTDVTPLQWSWR